MKDRPILFSAPMVRAIVAGTKTQTRRVVKPAPYEAPEVQGAMRHPGVAIFGSLASMAIGDEWMCPYGQPGDRLWMREAWRTTGDGGRCDDMPPRDLQPHEVWYEADGFPPSEECAGKLRPSMFMPRWASRITLEVTGVRVERLQDIDIEDCKSEGAWGPDESIVGKVAKHFGIDILAANPYLAYRMLWESINGLGSWEVNPWVWVVEFRRLEGGAA